MKSGTFITAARAADRHDLADRTADGGRGAVVCDVGVDDAAPFHPPITRLKRLTFWGAHDHDDSLPVSVIEGRKTVTADTLEAYYQSYGEYGDGSYAPGDLIEVYDLQRRPRCIIRATKVCNIKFGAIPEEVWRGETFASAEEFRRVHIEALAPIALHDDFELVTLHFELVEVLEST